MANWKIEGQYMETCNCAFLCPCITSNLAGLPTEGECKAVIAMKIERGEKDGIKLDGLSFMVVMHSPGAMIDGDLKVGLIVDENADEEQTAAIAAIASGEAGGPMANLAPLVSTMAGIEKRPISFTADGLKFTSKAGDLVDQQAEGVASMADETKAVCIDNTAHPVNSRLNLAKAVRSTFDAFGIKWSDTSGSRNGHFATFSWAG
ncbi:MAG: DUF1326 domain-containing protein [Anderseniella sp.]|jgi:hypothetical protein|nr:DUF1326 domain-containing protein [Anderseniella sp.]